MKFLRLKNINICLILIFLIRIIGVSAFGTDPPSTSDLERRSVTAVFAESPPAIDGDLSDAVWASAEPQGQFHRRNEPDRGDPSRVTTWFKVLYDSEYLYFAFEMHGVDPDRILHAVSKRDENVDRDDNICIYLDTFLDYRSVYFFQTNLLGTQRDIYSTGKGQQVDIGWDAIWDTATLLLSDGWSAEIRIPFKIFRFDWSDDLTFGLDILRGCSQREDVSEWCFINNRHNSTLDPQYYGELTGLKDIRKPRLLQVIGSLTASSINRNLDTDPYTDTTGWDKEEEIDGGLDLIWGVTPQITLNATLNPDFAQIEADTDELNLTGQELYLQERRPFFRENNAIFSVPDGVYPFYSRRIVDINTGLKLTGQILKSDFAALFLYGEDGIQEKNYFTVLRSQTPVTENFTVLGYLISKFNPDSLDNFENAHGEVYDSVDNDRNLVGGIDLGYQKREWQIDFHGYRSWYPDALRPWYVDKPVDDKNLFHLKAKYSRSNLVSAFHIMDIAIGYHPELGYINLTKMGNQLIQHWVWAQHNFPENHLLNFLELWGEWKLSYDRKDHGSPNNIGGELDLGFEMDNHLSFYINGNWYEDETFQRYGDFTRDENSEIINPTADYFYATLGHGDNRVRLLSGRLHWSDGGWNRIGFHGSTGQHYFSKIDQYEVFCNWTFLEKFSIELSVDYLKRYDPTKNHLEFLAERNPDTENPNDLWTDSEIWIFRDKTTYHFAEESYVRLIISGYQDSDEPDNRYDLSALVAYRYLPGSYIYLVYENSWSDYDYIEEMHLGITDLEVRRETLFLKLTYMLDV